MIERKIMFLVFLKIFSKPNGIFKFSLWFLKELIIIYVLF